MRLSSPSFAPILLLSLALASAAAPAGDEKITARNKTDYDIWVADTSAKLTPDAVRAFKGSAARDQTRPDDAYGRLRSGRDRRGLFAKVDGLTLPQFERLGAAKRALHRLIAQRDEAQKLFDDNSAPIRPDPGTTTRRASSPPASQRIVSGSMSAQTRTSLRLQADLAQIGK